MQWFTQLMNALGFERKWVLESGVGTMPDLCQRWVRHDNPFAATEEEVWGKKA